MTTPLKQYLFNEATSGTGPANLLDSGSTTANLPITYAGSYAWTTDNAGTALGQNGAGICDNTNVGTTLSALNGSKTATAEFLIQFSTTDFGGLGPIGSQIAGGADIFGVDLRTVTTGASGTAGPQLFYTTVADGDQEESGAAYAVSGGYHVMHCVLDTGATNRKTYYDNGFQAATSNALITANTTITIGGGNVEVYAARGATAGHSWPGSTQGYAAIHATALSASDCLARAVFLFADSDHDPGSATCQLRAASTNGGTNDVSTSTSDHSLSFTITIDASGNNRKVAFAIAYSGVSTGVTSVTFNGSSTGVHLTATQTSGTGGVNVYEILDADLPGSAGTYTIAVTVDGATGVACGSPAYVTGAKQSYASNTGLATGTGTSLTATLGSSASAGSIILGCLFDISFGDAPTSGANQLRLINQSTSSVVAQTVDAKYVPTAGSNSMSWSGLTNATQKIAVAIEMQQFVASITDQIPLGYALSAPRPGPAPAQRVDAVAPIGTGTFALTKIPSALSIPVPPRQQQSTPSVLGAIAPVGALLAGSLSSLGWDPAPALPAPPKTANPATQQPVAPVGTGTFALTKFSSLAPLLPATQQVPNRPALEQVAPIGTLLTPFLPSFGWFTFDGSPPPSRSLLISPVQGAEIEARLTSLTSVGWLTCDPLPKPIAVVIRDSAAQQPTGPLKPFLSPSTGWFPADYQTPKLSPPRPDPSAPTGPLTPFVSTTLGWQTIEAKPPFLPPPRAQEAQQPTGPLTPFVSTSTGWLRTDLPFDAPLVPPKVSDSAPIGSLLPPALSSLGWLGVDSRPVFPAAPRAQDPQQPPGPLVPFLSASTGWMGYVPIPFDTPLNPPRVSDSSPVGTLLTPQPFGWNAGYDQARPAPVIPRRVEPNAPVGTPFAIALPSNGWLATDNPRTPLVLSRSVPVDPVGNLLVTPPLPNASWLFATPDPRTPLLLQRAVVVDPVGTAFPFLAKLGPFWFLDQGPRAPAPPPRALPVDPVGSPLATTLSSLGWLYLAYPSPISAPARQPEPFSPLGALLFGGTPWADVGIAPARVPAPRAPDPVAPVGSLITVSLSSFGWHGAVPVSVSTAPAQRPLPSAPIGTLLTPATLPSLGWLGLDARTNSPVAPKLQDTSQPSGPLVPFVSASAGWLRSDVPYDTPLTPPRVAESSPVGSLLVPNGFGWFRLEPSRPATSASRPPEPTLSLGPLAFGGTPWATVDVPHAAPRALVPDVVQPVGAFIPPPPPSTNVSWMQVMPLPPRPQVFSPMAVEIASVASYPALHEPVRGPIIVVSIAVESWQIVVISTN